MYWADGRIYKGIWTNGIENAKKLPVKRLAGLFYPRQKVTCNQKSNKSPKLPQLAKSNRSMETRRIADSEYEVNREWRASSKQLPKGGIKALFNPNYNFEY